MYTAVLSAPNCILRHILKLHVPVTSKENEISLIVEGDTLPALKLWIMREERCQKTCNRMAESCAEVIEDHLWSVACHTAMVLRNEINSTYSRYSMFPI